MTKRNTLTLKIPFFHDLTAAVVEASRVKPGECVRHYGPNKTSGTLIRPGGRRCYPSFWIRDFAMSLESTFITPEELRHALFLTASKQMYKDWETPSGSIVPRGSIPDHITFDNIPIYFPGTNDYQDQGGKFGKFPSLDDHFYFIQMAWYLAIRYNKENIIHEVIDGMKLIDRLDLAFSVPPSRDNTKLVWCDESNRGVSFGFVDTVIHTEDLLFCSLLKYQAACQMAELHRLCKNKEKALNYEDIARTISKSISGVFSDDRGLLRASTGKSCQPDVWGTAFAIYLGAIENSRAQIACQALADAYAEGILSWRGNIRHILTTDDYSDMTVWESLVTHYPKNRYQNGAYWSTPTGWVCFAIFQVSEKLAVELALEFSGELEEQDFRKGQEFGAPFECIHPDGDYKKNPVYMTSVTCPYAAFRRLGWVR